MTPNIRERSSEPTRSQNQISITGFQFKDTEFVRDMETKYPEMTNEFKQIIAEQYELFLEKQSGYGPDNISLSTSLETDAEVRLSLMGLWFRMFDKYQRLKQLIVLNVANVLNDEATYDTWRDLSNYGIIAQIVERRKWGR